ncbi:hypothetical protein F5876DRAFT_69029 [Lentinula aff. lateritia]|uniref:Uncharacterized protein n=1 Tax=Lentinula aff. lateritia TaxID=2804960 RepID=A0ACC1TNQ0_9AGAR|nr:hypothetical protein F5876DRAFT_69029 [Lentinula aff. lateritia]
MCLQDLDGVLEEVLELECVVIFGAFDRERIPKVLLRKFFSVSDCMQTPDQDFVGLVIGDGDKPWSKGFHAVVKDVGKDLSLKSGLKVLISYDNPNLPEDWVDYDDLCHQESKTFRFLDDDPIQKKANHDSYYHFKSGYQPRYTKYEMDVLQEAQLANEKADLEAQSQHSAHAELSHADRPKTIRHRSGANDKHPQARQIQEQRVKKSWVRNDSTMPRFDNSENDSEQDDGHEDEEANCGITAQLFSNISSFLRVQNPVWFAKFVRPTKHIWGIITLDPLKAIKTLPGSLGHISRQPQTASSTNSSSNDEDEDDESIEDVTPKVKINPCRSVEISMVHEFPNTEEDVFYVQLPLPDGIEWKIRIFPSGSTSISSFGYFLQPVGHGFNVRLEADWREEVADSSEPETEA